MNQDQLRQLIYRLSFSLAVTALLLLSVEIGCFLVLRIERRHPVTESPRALLPLRREYNHSSVYDGQAWAPQYWREMRELQLAYQPYVVWGDYPYQGETIAPCKLNPFSPGSVNLYVGYGGDSHIDEDWYIKGQEPLQS